MTMMLLVILSIFAFHVLTAVKGAKFSMRRRQTLDSPSPDDSVNLNITCSRPVNKETSAAPKRKIFIDFGANDGHSIELFLNSSTLYPHEIESYGPLVKELRRTNDTGAILDWDVYAVEANKLYTNQLLRQQEFLT